jgi:hypothetical protein
VQGHVLPEVLWHEDVPAQGGLGAGHRQHERDPGEAGEGEAPPVRRWSKITACPTSQATIDSGENQTSRSMTNSRPLAAGWRAARGMGWPGVACQPWPGAG